MRLRPLLRRRRPQPAQVERPVPKTMRFARGLGWSTFLFFVVVLGAEVAGARGPRIASELQTLTGADSVSNRPLILMTAMAGLALVPFVGMMVTSFVKIAVVLSITRQAIGTQQAPPTTVITAEVDPLQSEGALLAQRLRAAGVDVEHAHFEGVTHEFFGMGAVVDKAREAVQVVRDDLGPEFRDACATETVPTKERHHP